MASQASARIRVGVGGWQFEPWRGVYYPDKLPQRRELEWSSRRLTAIEINATYYGSQKPDSFRKWAAEVPDGFKFSVKGSRFATNRRDLSQGADSVARFLDSGVTELGDRLGPLLWQFANTKKYDRGDMSAFLDLLPESRHGVKLRHVLEVRHDSFCTPDFIALARERNAAVAYAHHAGYPNICDVTADFVYARLQRGSDDIPTGYSPADLDAWAKRLRTWAEGGAPDDLEPVDMSHTPVRQARDVYGFVIHEGKVRAPAAAMEIIARLGPENAAAGDGGER
jgi:uncharacterized protein YecE (DUF72 family)